MTPVSRGIDRIEVTFDDPHLVANTGLLLVATLVVRVRLERLIDDMVDLYGSVGGALPGRKVLTLVHAMVAGGSRIDHADVLRSGATQAVLPHRVMAPSTLGTFLRAFTFGHVRQLDRVFAETLRRVWSIGAGPGSDRLVVDLDSTICAVCGKAKHGAGYGYTKELGYHPLVATRAGTGELLHVRMRKGSANTQRGTKRFIEELVARLRREGATGELVMRFDSGFWSNAAIATLGRLSVGYTMGVRMVKSVVTAISAIDEAVLDTHRLHDGRHGRGGRMHLQGTPPHRASDPIGRTTGDAVARVASLRLPHRSERHRGRSGRLPPSARHRRAGHQGPEGGGGHGARPFGELQCQCSLAGLCGTRPQPHPLELPARRDHPEDHLVVARTVRTRFLSVPGRMIDIAGTPTLRAPLEWPWARSIRKGHWNFCVLFRRSRCSRFICGRRTADDR